MIPKIRIQKSPLRGQIDRSQIQVSLADRPLRKEDLNAIKTMTVQQKIVAKESNLPVDEAIDGFNWR